MKLKPCPFCGGEAAHKRTHVCFGHGDYGEAYFVVCLDCGAKGPGFDDYIVQPYEILAQKAAEAWNRRAPVPAKIEEKK